MKKQRPLMLETDASNLMHLYPEILICIRREQGFLQTDNLKITNNILQFRKLTLDSSTIPLEDSQGIL